MQEFEKTNPKKKSCVEGAFAIFAGVSLKY